MTSSEVKSVARFLLQSQKFTRGPRVKEFEKMFEDYFGSGTAIATNSGTTALHLAFRALGLKKGDEVITTPFSYIASVNCLAYEGVIPRFVDINPRTLNIDIEQIESAITKNTKAILIVDVFGLPVGDRKKLTHLKRKYKLRIIEDACEAIGKKSALFPIGNDADIIVFGFHENKQLTTGGEGGMLVCQNKKVALYAKAMRDQGRSAKKDWISHVVLGFNYRMTEMQAVIGIEKLRSISAILSIRSKIAQKYHRQLSDISGDIALPQDLTESERSWFCYFVVCRDSLQRSELAEYLLKRGIQTASHYFIPLYLFPMYKKYAGNFPVTELLSKQVLVLPLYEKMSDKEVISVASCVRSFYSL